MPNWIEPTFTPGLVSVVIPSYNREKYILDAISSVYSQTYRPIECIIVDDGSTDNSNELIKEYKNKYENKDFRINYHSQKNSGAQVARNIGTQLSKGEYIQYLDSDDLLDPLKIDNQVTAFKNNKNIDGIYGDWKKGSLQMNEVIKGAQENDLINQFLGNRCIPIFSFLFRRECINKIGKWDIKIKRNQEIDFHLSGVLNKCEFRYIQINCGLWRIHEGERIASKTGLKELLVFYKKWINILDEKKLLSHQIKITISNTIFWLIHKYQSSSTKIKFQLLKIGYSLNINYQPLNTSFIKTVRATLGGNVALIYYLFRLKYTRRQNKKD